MRVLEAIVIIVVIRAFPSPVGVRLDGLEQLFYVPVLSRRGMPST